MRIIAGKYRGRRLQSPPSLETRPTSDRLRETLFNIIAPRIAGARFLDLCAGSGAVGIEALSRGAAHVTLVDRSRQLGHLIASNLALCVADPDESAVVITDAIGFLRRSTQSKVEPWAIVFFDPPYSADYSRVLNFFGGETSRLLAEDGLLVVEHHHKNDLPETVGSLRRRRVVKQSESALSFYQEAEGED